MRKIKITALLLAVLMIVTAFAGCASKSTVTNLDNKVNDLDASIEEQKAALSGIESTLATISKALENQGSSENLDEVIKDIEENEKATADLAGAIKDLQSAIEDLKKEPATQAPATEDVKVAASQYSAKLEAFEGSIDDDKANYTVESLAAIRDIIGKAEAAIANSATADDAKKAYEDAVAAIAGYPSVNGKLYAYVVELKGNITDKSADKVAEAEKALEDAIKFYEKNGDKEGINSDALTAYEVSATEDMNLVDEINWLINAQENRLPALKGDAADLNKAIAAIDASYSFEKITDIVVEYKQWAAEATELSAENLALVTGYDALMAAQASALNTYAAKKVFDEDRIYSKLFNTFDNAVKIFEDYDILKATNDQVVFTYTTKNVKGKPALALTSEIYAAIDAKIAAWQKEYELIDDAVEYVIDTVKGEHYYEKYKADRALVQAFEADYNKFVAADGVFTAIKALNSKRLNADAVEVALAYEKNGWDIQNWREASEKAYAAALAADTTAYRNVVDDTAYAAVLEANFNAMVVYADLCQYNGDAKYPEYGIKELDDTQRTTDVKEAIDVNEDGTIDAFDLIPGSTTDYYKGYKYTTEYARGFKALDDLYPNTFYFELYDFSDVKLVNFILTDYKAAKAAAEAINKKIEGFKPAQAISIRSVVEGIGGYVKLNATKDKLLALEEADFKALAALRAPETIAEFDYVYNKTQVYNLTALLKLDLYEEKLALTEAYIEAADKVAAELNSAYAALVGNKPTVLLTMNNVDAVANVYNIYTQKWLKQARVDMDVAKVINTTGAGVKEYEVKNILVPYTAIDDKVGTTYTVLDGTNGMIVGLNKRAALLKEEANLVLSAYQMLDTMYGYDKSNVFGLEPMSNSGYISGLYSGSQKNAYVYGVSAAVSEDPMTDKGVDASGYSYEKDQYKWTIEYITFDYDGGKGGTPVFKTDKFVGYYFTNNVKDFAAAYRKDGTDKVTLAKDLKAKVWSSTGAAISGDAAISTEVLTGIGTYVENYDIAAMSASSISLQGKLIPAYALATLALELDARFQLDNYGTYDPILEAKKAFDPANNGYGFTFIKGMTYMKLLATVSGLSEAHKAAIKSAKTIDELRVVANAVVIESADDGRLDSSKYIDLDIAFGAFAGVDAEFDIETSVITYEAADYKADFDLDKADFKVPGIVIYAKCLHTGMTGACLHQSGVCVDCGETISGTDQSSVALKTVLVEFPFVNGQAAKKIELVVSCACGITEEKTVEPSTAYPLTIVDSDNALNAGDNVVFSFNGVEYKATVNAAGTGWDFAKVNP